MADTKNKPISPALLFITFSANLPTASINTAALFTPSFRLVRLLNAHNRQAPVGAIVGGVIGGVVVIAAIVLAALFKTGRLNTCKCCGPTEPANASLSKGSVPAGVQYPVMGEASVRSAPAADSASPSAAFGPASTSNNDPPPAYEGPTESVSRRISLNYPVAEGVHSSEAPPPPPPNFDPTPPPAYEEGTANSWAPSGEHL